MHHFSSKFSKTSHLNHKNPKKKANFPTNRLLGALRPRPPIGFGPVLLEPKLKCFSIISKKITDVQIPAVHSWKRVADHFGCKLVHYRMETFNAASLWQWGSLIQTIHKWFLCQNIIYLFIDI